MSAVLAILVLGSAATALSLRNVIHCALLLIASWLGIAAFYLWAGAEFVAFAQALVYVGAVSMVVLFAVLLTRRTREDLPRSRGSARRALAGIASGAAVAGVLALAIVRTPLASDGPVSRAVEVRQIGESLMGPQAAALLAAGVLLTVALMGAVLVAAPDSEGRKEGPR